MNNGNILICNYDKFMYAAYLYRNRYINKKTFMYLFTKYSKGTSASKRLYTLGGTL